MNFRMRDEAPRVCTLLATALLTACGGGSGTSDSQTATDSAATTTTGSSSPTSSSGTTQDATSNPPNTDDGNTAPTTEPTPTSTSTDPTTDPTTGGTDDSTTGPTVCPYIPMDGMPGVKLELLASGFDRPVLAVPDPQQPNRLFVVEQGGHIKILEAGETTAPADDAAFLFLPVKNADTNTIGPEMGLLGFAFHPDFPADPRVYVNYNPADGGARTHIDEYKLDPNDPDKVDLASRRFVYAVGQPDSNHKGGMIVFGPDDGMLYIGMGDGGGSDGVYGTPRDNLSPLAKMLRIDVEADGSPDSNKACDDCAQVDGFDFTVPADNPFVGDDAYAPEIWATGVRNPWRFHFDGATGLLYAGEVGQGTYEEVSLISKAADYGWNIMEGNHCFKNNMCDTSAAPNAVNSDGMTAPIAEYSHDDSNRCSITGLGVYHSCEVPAWDGVYFYADYCSSELFALRWSGDSVEDLGVVFTHDERIIGSGANGYGDVLVTTVVTNGFNQIQDGKLYRVIPSP